MKNGRDYVKKTRFYFYHPFPLPSMFILTKTRQVITLQLASKVAPSNKRTKIESINLTNRPQHHNISPQSSSTASANPVTTPWILILLIPLMLSKLPLPPLLLHQQQSPHPTHLNHRQNGIVPPSQLPLTST
jgi:hypothetical protein